MSEPQTSTSIPHPPVDVVRALLGEPSAVVGSWEAVALQGGFGTLAGQSGVHLLSGQARVGADERAWRVVLKTLAPVADQDDPTHIRYWRREPLLYGSGMLGDLPPGLRAPRCYGRDEQADGSVWLWLEHVQEDGERAWPLSRWTLAGRHLGQMNGAYLAAPASRRWPLPRAPWLGGQRLRTWLERHTALVPRIATAADDPGLRHWWPRPVVDAILRLWEERDAICAALERLPQTFGHGDAIRRNLLARRGADGVEETVGVDWENAGYYAVGEEVGQTVSVAAAFFQLQPADLPALDETLFASYFDGLHEAGWRGDRRAVRLAYCAHAALRNGFNAVGAIRPDPARLPAIRQSQGRDWEELAERRAAIRPFLLERADEARALIAALQA